MTSQLEKAKAFQALHARPGAFIIPNPWDAGTAKLLAAMGFEAVATTSLGLANMLGSSAVTLDAILDNCRAIAAATFAAAHALDSALPRSAPSARSIAVRASSMSIHADGTTS